MTMLHPQEFLKSLGLCPDLKSPILFGDQEIPVQDSRTLTKTDICISFVQGGHEGNLLGIQLQFEDPSLEGSRAKQLP